MRKLTSYALSIGKENVYGTRFRIENDKAGKTYFTIYPKEKLVMAITYDLLPADYNEIELSDIFVRGIK